MKDKDDLSVEKWLIESIRPHRHKNQRKKDIKLITDGFINFFTGFYGLMSILFKPLLLLFKKKILKSPDNKYKNSATKLSNESYKFITGALVMATFPILIVRFLFRCLVNETTFTKSVFNNSGLMRLASESKYNDDEYNSDTIRKLQQKSCKYMLNEQDDCKVLNEILQNPILTNYQKIRQVKDKICELDKAYEERRAYINSPD